MKVYCIDDMYVSVSLEIGEWYKVISEDEHTYLIETSEDTYLSGFDKPYTKRLSKSKFLTVEQIREKKLNILGI